MRFVKWISLGFGALVAVGAMASVASANTAYNTPLSAAKVSKVPLVSVFGQCAVSNSTWASDHHFSNATCVPPAAPTADIKWGPKGTGNVSLQVKSSNTKDYNVDTLPDSPTNADIIITTVFADIRTSIARPASPGCPAQIVGDPFCGQLAGGAAGVRITSQGSNAVSGDRSGTGKNINFPVQPAPGNSCVKGKCKIVTSADATVPPDVVHSGEQTNTEVGVPINSADGQVRVDAPNGNAFATPGAFIP